MIHSADMSTHLQQERYWGSYNIPFFSDIWTASGFGNQQPPAAYSHSDCPRAQIFKSQQASVDTLANFQARTVLFALRTDLGIVVL